MRTRSGKEYLQELIFLQAENRSLSLAMLAAIKAKFCIGTRQAFAFGINDWRKVISNGHVQVTLG